MKSIQPKRKSRVMLVAVALLLALVGLAAGYFVIQNQSTDNDDMFHGGRDSSGTNGTSNDGSKSPAPGDTKDTDAKPPQNEDFVGSPNRPVDIDESYPIETPHYRIEQKSGTSYKITLYPLVNNPEDDAYDTQLRLYKQEALDYLNRRYGDTSRFSYEWIPNHADSV